jgi:crossover junction endodeoxyribonuclease RusA
LTAVLCPWPPRQLSPNARADRRAVAGIRAKFRADCGWCAKAAGVRQMPPAPLHVDLTFCPPDRRPRDMDNMLSSFKAGLDGIADVVGVDDSFWSLTIRKGEPVPGGEVVVRVGPPVDAVAVELRGAVR